MQKELKNFSSWHKLHKKEIKNSTGWQGLAGCWWIWAKVLGFGGVGFIEWIGWFGIDTRRTRTCWLGFVDRCWGQNGRDTVFAASFGCRTVFRSIWAVAAVGVGWGDVKVTGILWFFRWVTAGWVWKTRKNI